MKIRNISLIAIAIVALISVPVGTASVSFDPTGSRWQVADFRYGTVGSYHLVPWEFQYDPQNTVHAGRLWAGVWNFVPGESNRISVSIALAGGGYDSFEVVFLSPKWFIALKNNELYRLGKRI